VNVTSNLHLEPRLVRTDRAIRPPCAYLLSGHDAGVWLAEMTRWAVPLAEARIYVLPRTRADVRPTGALVVLPDGTGPAVSQRALLYGRFGSNLLLPVDAKLLPAMTQEEVATLAPYSCSVFHPAIGLVGFEETDALRVSQLLSAPPTSKESWDRAQGGMASGIELRSVEALPAPSVEEIIEQGRNEIGPKLIADLPPADDERFHGPAGKALGHAMSGGLGILGGAAKALRAVSGAQGGGLDRLIRRVGQRLEDIRRQLQEERYRQIARLLHLLERSLEAGIRFALPLEGKLARGMAQPSAKLHHRNMDFDLGQIGGGGPADPWAVPEDVRQRLKELYRQAADREIARGRFRKAAYIFAHLLADYHAAANVLVQGRHLREAAVLYKDYLHNPNQAAQCLEGGGLLPEAIEIYRELGRHEKIGDLYATLSDAESATAAYRQAVESCMKQGDCLHAGWLLESRLGSPDEAIETLWGAWPQSTQAPKCIEEHFLLLGRLGRHTDAQQRAAELRACPNDPAPALVEVMAGLAGKYPYGPVCHQMADVARVVAGQALPQASRDDVTRLTAAVAKLAPGDRLLQRDADRYLRGRRITPRSAPLTKLTRSSWIALPGGQWSSFAATRDYLCAAGAAESPGMLQVMVHDWTNTQACVEFGQLATLAERPLLAACPIGQRSIIAVGRRNMRLAVQTVPFAGPAGRLEVGTPSWLPTPLLAVACDSEGGVLAVTAEKEEFLISRYSPGGELVWTRNAKRRDCHKDLSCTIVPQAGGFFLAVDCYFFYSTGPDDDECRSMDEVILGVAACSHDAKCVQAITTRSGGWVLHSNGEDGIPHRGAGCEFALGPPDYPGESLVTFLREDLLVAVTESGGGVYRVDDSGVVRCHDLPSHPARPLAVLSGPRPGTFAVASEHRVDLYEIPHV